MAVIAIALFAGCQKDIKKENETPVTNIQTAANNSSQLAADVQAKLSQLRASLADHYGQRFDQVKSLSAEPNAEFENTVLKVLKVIEPTTCDWNTPVFVWYNNQFNDWTEDLFYFAYETGMTVFPFYYSRYFENSSANQYFGLNGKYTHTVTKTFKDLKRFWNIDADNMVVVGMHGNMLLDREKVMMVEKRLFPWETEYEANFWVNAIVYLAQNVPQYRGGNHPVFTYNASALPASDNYGLGATPNKIIIGDGVLEAYAALNYDDVAPQAILAHEFGHHIQYQLNLIPSERGPEVTRRIELMADAYSAYYLSHARGASMQWKRVRQFLQVFFNTGDCAFYSYNHHGTPTQRMAAAEWAYHVADDAQKQGHILTAQQFTALFEAQLPAIVSQ